MCIKRRRRGFTLIELLVVIVILGILMAVAVPTYLRQQTKAQDSRTQQYLTTAFEAIRAGLPDTNNQYPSSTSMVSWIQQSEPELTAERGDCLTGVTSAPVDAVLVDPGSTASSLQLCARSQSGNVWKLTASASGAQQLLDGTLVPLSMSGNEITDATREAALSWTTSQQGGQTDGASVPGGVYVGRAATNLFGRGQDDVVEPRGSSNPGWVPVPWPGSLYLDTTIRAPFSPDSIGWNNSGPGGYFLARTATGLAAPAGTNGVASVWVYYPSGPATNPVLNLEWVNTDSTITDGPTVTITPSPGWRLIDLPAAAVAAGETGDRLQIKFYTAQNTDYTYLRVAHPMIEMGQTVVAPYVATSGGATASIGSGRVQAPASLIGVRQGWVAMRVRLGWASSAAPAAAAYFLDWASSGSDFIVLYWNTSQSKWAVARLQGGAGGQSMTADTFTAGDERTLILAWDSTGTYFSLNGAPFVFGAGTNLPSLPSTFDIGESQEIWGSAYPSDSDVKWFACGTGTLTSADAATINSWGDSDPARASFPTAAQATMVWNGVGSTGSLK